MVVFVLVAMAGGRLIIQFSHASSSCTVSATLVNSCRPWLGAAVSGYPQVASDKKSQLLYHEQRIGRQVDVVHTYHPVGDNALSTSDTYFATRAGTYLFTNWKPTSNWATISSNNAGIDSMASSIKAVAPAKIFLTVHHEPENDVTYDPNCPSLTYKGSFGTPTDYRNMWSYVKNRFQADGVTNVVWVMNYMGYSYWDCLIPDMWPGNSVPDWVTWDAYSSSDTSTFANTVGRIYTLLTSLNDSSHDYLSKTWGASEWGDCKTADQAHVYQYYDQAKAAIDAGTYPRLKMLMVYDDSGNNAGPGCLTEYSLAGVLDATEQSHYNALADDPRFTDAYYAPAATPTPTPTPTTTHTPTPTPTTAAPGATSGSSGGPTTGITASSPTTATPAGPVSGNVPGTNIDTTYLTNGTHTITVTSGGVTKTETITVNNKLNPYQTIRNFLFAGFGTNKTLMNAGMAGLIVVLLGSAGVAARFLIPVIKPLLGHHASTL